MTWIRPRALFTLTVIVLCAGLAAQAPGAVRIGELSYLDRQYMGQQRGLLAEIAQRNFGRSFSGQRERDLELLQRLLDQRLVKPDQTRELQAMGVIMGDLLAEDLGMHWVVYEDELGRSRALRYRETDVFLFPVTMISRRREVGNLTPVAEIYEKARAIVAESRPPLPFQ